jgi:hypothetical protein
MMSNRNEAKTRRGVTLFFTTEELTLVLELTKKERSSLSRIAERLILAEARKLEAQNVGDVAEENTPLPFVSRLQSSYDVLG